MFMHFCSNMLIREPKQRGKAPAMIVFCSGSLSNMLIREPEQNTIIAGAFPRCLGSLINMFEQKCMNSAILKSISVSKKAVFAFFDSPFLLSPSTYHSTLEAYALFPKL